MSLGYSEKFFQLSEFLSKQNVTVDLASESMSICIFTYSAHKLNVQLHLHSFWLTEHNLPVPSFYWRLQPH